MSQSLERQLRDALNNQSGAFAALTDARRIALTAINANTGHPGTPGSECPDRGTCWVCRLASELFRIERDAAN